MLDARMLDDARVHASIKVQVHACSMYVCMHVTMYLTYVYIHAQIR